MQLIPFIFAIILAFFMIISRLASENVEDATVLKLLKEDKIQECNLLKKIERRGCYQVVKRNPKQKDLPKKTSALKRPKKGSQENSKLSLRVFNAPMDESMKQFIKKLFLTILEKNYPKKASTELLDGLLIALIEQKTEELAQINLKNLKLQKVYLSLLTDEHCPLERLFTLKTFEKNTLFYFSHLQKMLFEEVIGQDIALKIYEIEEKFFKDFKQPIVPKEKWLTLLPALSYQINPVFMDRLICFNDPKKTFLKVESEGSSSVYTWIEP